MYLYENVFLFSGNLTEKTANDKISGVEKIIQESKGKIHKREYWGIRSLAYKIKKNSKAHYFLLNTENDPSAITKIKDNLKVDEDYLRFFNLRVKEFDKEDSIIYKNSKK
ncbi:MAG: 30S ribosomal protein S6 [Rickettsiales bacterium]|nr:30S ribosomal protein S6 [Rickettsiales bacterium]